MDIDKANSEACERMMESRPTCRGLGESAGSDPGHARELVAARRTSHHLGKGVRTHARRHYRSLDF